MTNLLLVYCLVLLLIFDAPIHSTTTTRQKSKNPLKESNQQQEQQQQQNLRQTPSKISNNNKDSSKQSTQHLRQRDSPPLPNGLSSLARPPALSLRAVGRGPPLPAIEGSAGIGRTTKSWTFPDITKPSLSSPQQLKLGDFLLNYPRQLYNSDFDQAGNLIGHQSAQNWRHHPITSDSALVASDNTANSKKYLVFNQKSSKRYQHLSRSQEQEDIWLYEHWFYGKREGIILESGALDGVKYSNSFLFEKYANWQAIHIEADLTNYQHLINHRRHAININAALCNESQSLHFIDRRGPAARGFYEFMTDTFLKSFHPEVYSGNVTLDSLRIVPCMPLSHILSTLQIDKIDIWILDVEGAEESVLKGVDFNAVRINAISMECDDTDVSKNNRKLNILKEQGFDCLVLPHNCYCKHKQFTPVSKPSLST